MPASNHPVQRVLGSDHPQLYQVMQSVDLDFVQAMEQMGCIETLDLLKVFRSGGIEW
jgi:hypothetical protein